MEENQLKMTNLKSISAPDCASKNSNKCKHCDYTSSQAGNLKTHLKTHSGEKTDECNQCDYASPYVK